MVLFTFFPPDNVRERSRMTPFYTSTTPVFRGLPNNLFFIFLFFPSFLSLAYTRRRPPLGAIRSRSASASSPHSRRPMSRPSGPFLVRCCGDTTQLSATVYSILDLFSRQLGQRHIPFKCRHGPLPSHPVVQYRHSQILSSTSSKGVLF